MKKSARTLLSIANDRKLDRYIESRPKPIDLSQKSNIAGIYLGFDSTIGMARVQIPKTGQTLNARVITTGQIVEGTRVMVKVDGPIALINEMPA